jgi:hypothetical protein
MKLLEACPVPVAAIHREMVKLRPGIKRAKLDSWSAGRAFPSDEDKAALAEALRILGHKTIEYGDQVETIARPAKLPEPKKGPGQRGRPRRETVPAPPPPARSRKKQPRSAEPEPRLTNTHMKRDRETPAAPNRASKEFMARRPKRGKK